MNAVSSNDLQDILNSMHGCSHQERGLLIQDLRDCSREYQSLRMELRYVAVNGDRIILNWNIKSNRSRFISINGIRNPVLISKYEKLFTDVINSENTFKYLKHLNDMSPEEYEWCIGME